MNNRIDAIVRRFRSKEHEITPKKEVVQPTFGIPIVSYIGIDGGELTSDALAFTHNHFMLIDGKGAGNPRIAENCKSWATSRMIQIDDDADSPCPYGQVIEAKIDGNSIHASAEDGCFITFRQLANGQIIANVSYANIERINGTTDDSAVFYTDEINKEKFGLEIVHSNLHGGDRRAVKHSDTTYRTFSLPISTELDGNIIGIMAWTDEYLNHITMESNDIELHRVFGANYAITFAQELINIVQRQIRVLANHASQLVVEGNDAQKAMATVMTQYRETESQSYSASSPNANKKLPHDDRTFVYLPLN